MNLANILEQQAGLLNDVDNVIRSAAMSNRPLSVQENSAVKANLKQIAVLEEQVADIQSKTTLNGRDVLLEGGSRSQSQSQSQAPVVLGIGEAMQPAALSVSRGERVAEKGNDRATGHSR